MLNGMHVDLIGKYEYYPIAKEMWDQLKFDFSDALITRLRNQVLKFAKYRKDSKHMMTEHLRLLSGRIRDLKVARNILTDELQF